MSKAEVKYVGPLKSAPVAPAQPYGWVRNPLVVAFGLSVVLPTLLALIYFVALASPRYVSEARFVVRARDQQTPAALGLALSGVGLSAAATDAFIVHEFIHSRDAVTFLEKRRDLRTVFSPKQADLLSRAQAPWDHSREGLFKGVQRFLVVGYDSTTGISTLRVQAFSPHHAQAVAQDLLVGGEALINELNERASRAAVSDAERSVLEAQERLTTAQGRLAAFRNRERVLDPAVVAKESSEVIARLTGEAAALRAERDQLRAAAPQSPQLSTLDQRIAAFERQIEVERSRLAGPDSSLAPKIGTYESMVFDREFAERNLGAARQALEAARVDARSQQLYLARVVEPNLPDESSHPKRWLSVLAVFSSCLLLFGVGYLIWASIREHRHD